MSVAEQIAKGNLFIVAAPSGGGKTSLVTKLINTLSNLVVSTSYTTRPIRPGEVDGENYHFVDEKTFHQMEKENAFIETAYVFEKYYGTAKAEVDARLDQGIDVILEIDWQGAASVRNVFSDTISVFILPPSLAELRQRILDRKQNEVADMELRLKTAASEIVHCEEFDYLIVNDDFDHAFDQLKSIFVTARLKTESQKIRLKNLIQELT